VLPEGITVAADGTLYVSSIGGGAIFRGHVDEPHLDEWVPAGDAGRTQAAGIHVDRRGRVFVAAAVGADGVLDVYDRQGRLLARREPPVQPAALNDLVLTRDAVYVTDSVRQVVYRAVLRGREIGELEEWLDLNPHSPAPPDDRFLNGIVAGAGRRVLLVADLMTEVLFRVHVATRAVEIVDLGGAEWGGDGMLLEGRDLYAVIWDDQPDGSFTQQVRAARLAPDLRSGTVVARVDHPSFLDPTTLARDRDRLLVVNSQLLHQPGTPPFTVTAIPDPLRRRR
jgi:sugar lactone lactonase YvrE